MESVEQEIQLPRNWPAIPRQPAVDLVEAKHQEIVVNWCVEVERAIGVPGFRRLVHASANGGVRPSRVNAKGQRYCPAGAALRRQGVQEDAPDLAIHLPRGPHHGAFIEMKRYRRGDKRNGQRLMQRQLSEQGYAATFAHGAAQACGWLSVYLLQGPFNLSAPPMPQEVRVADGRVYVVRPGGHDA